MSQDQTKKEMDQAIRELEKKGINYNAHRGDTTGLGDVVEGVLTSMGITEDRFKQWFHLSECNCSKRKKWLNNLLSWKKKNG